MNKENLGKWRNAVDEHLSYVSQLSKDQEAIEDMMIEHINRFFNWDEIEFSENYRKIRLYFGRENSPVIPEDIGSLEMDWRVTTDFTDKLGTGVVIEIYPYGLDGVD